MKCQSKTKVVGRGSSMALSPMSMVSAFNSMHATYSVRMYVKVSVSNTPRSSNMNAPIMLLA